MRQEKPTMARELPRVTKVTAGIDWVSATLPRGALDYHVWVADCYWALEQLAKEGFVLEHRTMQGYEGMGFLNCFVGENDRGAFAQVTGEKANWFYPYTEHPKTHVSRIDAQITVQTDIANYNEGKRCLVAARTHNKTLPENKRRKTRMLLGDGGADTVYIGSTSADKQLRIYNKEAQSEELQYTRCWRYEAMLRNNPATGLYRSVLSEVYPAAEFILSFVVDYCRQRGISIRGLEHIEPVALEVIVKVPTDIERKLKWLKEQVKPTLEKLSAAGYGDQAAEALGLWIPKET